VYLPTSSHAGTGYCCVGFGLDFWGVGFWVFVWGWFFLTSDPKQLSDKDHFLAELLNK